VAAMAPVRVAVLQQSAAARRSVGHRIAWAVAAMLLLAMFVLAPSAGSGGARRWVEFALEIDFVALTLWLGMRSLGVSQ
jgi:formate-dependent nitrite reductase membrane component NrfD